MPNKLVSITIVMLTIVTMNMVAPALRAEDGAPGTAEVFASAGVATSTGGGGSQAAFGGGVSFGIAKRLFGVGEFGFIPSGGSTINLGGATTTASARTYTFDGAVHYVFPLESSKVVPYVLGGIGLVHGSGEYSTSVNGTTISGSVSENAVALVWGGGLRLALGERFGIKPEIKAYTHDGTFVRLGLGIYYQFGR